MATAADTPHADSLQISASPNGKWLVFDFKVGDKHAFVSMDVENFPDAFRYLLSVLNLPALASITGPDIETYGYHSAIVVKPSQVSASIIPLGQGIVLNVALPGGVRMGWQFDLADVPKLLEAIEAAKAKCEERQNLTKQ